MNLRQLGAEAAQQRPPLSLEIGAPLTGERGLPGGLGAGADGADGAAGAGERVWRPDPAGMMFHRAGCSRHYVPPCRPTRWFRGGGGALRQVQEQRLLANVAWCGARAVLPGSHHREGVVTRSG